MGIFTCLEYLDIIYKIVMIFTLLTNKLFSNLKKQLTLTNFKCIFVYIEYLTIIIITFFTCNSVDRYNKKNNYLLDYDRKTYFIH